jgi:hypothetical protein
MSLFSSIPPFIWSANDSGLAVRFSDPRRYKKAQEGRAKAPDQLAFIRMQMLAECGQAVTHEVDYGIFIAAADAVRLDKDTRDCFCLPSIWPSGLRLQTSSVPQLTNFRLRLGLVDADARVIWEWNLRGPVLELRGEYYLPTAAQFAALSAYDTWRKKDANDELSNLSLLATLREAWKEGCRIDLEAYRDTIIVSADELSLDVREENPNGDLILRPVVEGDFPALDADSIEERLGQFNNDAERAVLRVGQTIVLLNRLQTAQAKAIAARPVVPRNQRDLFEENPPKWLAENVFPDIELEFSPRVTGVGVWRGGYLGARWEATEDWFGKQPEIIKKRDKPNSGKIDRKIQDQETSTQEKEPDQLVPLIIPNDDELEFGWRFPELAVENAAPLNLDFDGYARSPLSHQKEAVRWLLGHSRRALQRLTAENKKQGLGAGALFADDMGLGKTFSTLMFLREWFNHWRKSTAVEPPAVLVVAPLSLLENWKIEIESSFPLAMSVFTRVLLAQANADLDKVRCKPGSRDRAAPGKVIEYGLQFGDRTPRSIDYPGSCLLTTYQTLRDYRFSFAKAQWGAVVFDEAQNIKNPNALQTIASKALKSIFRIALTGTPVENHLGDFWCILDTVEPGPLGSFAEFKRNWIAPMSNDPERMAKMGKELRDHVGNLMLRRMKEDRLQGLPAKSGDRESIPINMTAEQIDLYDSVIAAANQDRSIKGDQAQETRNRQLAALWQLRQVSLHPNLLGGGTIAIADAADDSRSILCRSGKLVWMLECLDKIKEAGEKALIFCVQKKLQEALAFHLAQVFGIEVPVINGDTKATAKKNQESTRQGLIEKFSAQNGFGICVLSPIAAGAGLNIQTANHVIHLERHWNPAKEDQATDRVYRIGQSRPVYVYLPTLVHPEMDSFDQVLHRLLARKRALQGALGLVPPEAVSGPEIIDEIFGKDDSQKKKTERLAVEEAIQLSWRLFEALIATIYKQQAEQVYLTPGVSDHGCDVVVLGWGNSKRNLLIQCKQCSSSKLDSERAVREIEGARPFYEKTLGVTFQNRCLHTTAVKYSRRTKKAADVCNVKIYGRLWLAEMLEKCKITLAEVLAADNRRQNIV